MPFFLLALSFICFAAMFLAQPLSHMGGFLLVYGGMFLVLSVVALLEGGV